MKIRRHLIPAMAVAIVPALFIGWRYADSASSARAERAELIAQRPALRDEIDRWKQRRASAEQEMANLRRGKAEGATSTPSSIRRVESSPPSYVQQQEQMQQHPELHQLFFGYKRAELWTGYGPFFNAQELTTEQIEALGDAMIRHEIHEQDLRSVGRAQDLSFDDAAIAAEREKAANELVQSEVAVLGEYGQQLLREYERALPVWKFVNCLAGVAALADLPFTAEQAEKLTQVLAESSERYRRGDSADLNGLDWRDAETRAAEILSPEQLELSFRIEPPGEGSARWTRKLNAEIIHIGVTKPKSEDASTD